MLLCLSVIGQPLAARALCQFSWNHQLKHTIPFTETMSFRPIWFWMTAIRPLTYTDSEIYDEGRRWLSRNQGRTAAGPEKQGVQQLERHPDSLMLASLFLPPPASALSFIVWRVASCKSLVPQRSTCPQILSFIVHMLEFKERLV